MTSTTTESGGTAQQYRLAQARRLRRYCLSLGLKGTDPYPPDLDISPICTAGPRPQIVPEDIDFLPIEEAFEIRLTTEGVTE